MTYMSRDSFSFLIKKSLTMLLLVISAENHQSVTFGGQKSLCCCELYDIRAPWYKIN